MVSTDHNLSVRHLCALLTLTRSNLYYQPKGESTENLQFMAIFDRQFLETPWYGSRKPFGTFAAEIPCRSVNGPVYAVPRSQVRAASGAAVDAPHAAGADLPRTQHQ